MIKKRVLIYGWFGHENLGDELILKSIIDSVRKSNSDVIINVMGSKPRNIEKYHEDINRVSTNVDSRFKSILRLIKYNPLNVILNIIKSDYLVIGSGGALSDWNPESTISLFYIINLFTRKLKKPVALLGVGAGPITRPESKEKFKNVLGPVKFITVRDKESYELLKGLGLDNVHLTNDVVFDMETYFENQRKDNKQVSHNKKIGVVVAPLFFNDKNRYNRYKKAIIDYILKLKDEGYKVTLIPFQYNYDIDFMKEINTKTNVSIFEEGKTNMWGILDVMKQQDLIVGMRFHAVVTALLLNIPVIPIIYHSKVFSVARDFELTPIAQEIGDGSNWKDKDISVEKLFIDTKDLYSRISEEKKRIKEIFANSAFNENTKLLKEMLK